MRVIERYAIGLIQVGLLGFIFFSEVVQGAFQGAWPDSQSDRAANGFNVAFVDIDDFAPLKDFDQVIPHHVRCDLEHQWHLLPPFAPKTSSRIRRADAFARFQRHQQSQNLVSDIVAIGRIMIHPSGFHVSQCFLLLWLMHRGPCSDYLRISLAVSQRRILSIAAGAMVSRIDSYSFGSPVTAV